MTSIDVAIYLSDAQRHLDRVCTGADPLAGAQQATEAVLRASRYTAMVGALFPNESDGIAEALHLVAPLVAEAAAKWVSRDLVSLALSAVAAFVVERIDDSLQYDRKTYAALLSCELSAAICKREIALRGDPFARSIAATRAWKNDDFIDHRLQ